MHQISRQGIVASLIGAGLAFAVAYAPVAPSPVGADTPRGAVTPMAAPGFSPNSPTTTGAQGGQASVTVDDSGKLRAVGRATFAPRTGVQLVRKNTTSTTRPKGTYKNGVWVAPRATLPPRP